MSSSGDHNRLKGYYASGSGSSEEDRDTETLWNDFENCASTVTLLYRDPGWRSLQTAAASTTQLYKSALDSRRRGFDNGYHAGKIALAKEIMNRLTTSGKVDVSALLELVYDNLRMGGEEPPRIPEPVLSNESVAAVHLFQQALSPSAAASPQRVSSELTSFLASQMQRRRKRQRSPSSPSIIKKFRKS